jgi:4-diphosphocytidyl-2-C-methyl-D-erythritol kinase
MVSRKAENLPESGALSQSLPAFPSRQNSLVVVAPAKLNLFLEVLGKRPDGFHQLETLMVAIDLFDTLELRSDPAGTITISCDNPEIPTGSENLIYRAALRLREFVGRENLGVFARLTKRIPTQAGLAGGSSDAAATLVALNHIWQLRLAKADLASIAAEIGSDIAFFLELPAAWCTGRGEIVEPELPCRTFDFLLILPPVGLSTAAVFRQLTLPTSPISGENARAAFRAGDPSSLGAFLHNRLQAPAFALSPAVERVYHRLIGLGPSGCMMSGSGSAVFAVCRDRSEATRLAAAFRAATPTDEPASRIEIVRALSPDPA